MIIAYLRVTIDREQLDKQKEVIDRYAQIQGWEIGKWVTDIADRKRKGSVSTLSRMIDRMEAGDKVLVVDIARLGRTLSEVMTILEKCMSKGIHVYSITDRYVLDDELDMKIVADVCHLIADIEHNLMSVRTKEALNNKRDREGVQLGRPRGTTIKQTMLEANKETIMRMLERGDTVVMICKRFGIAKTTFYQFKKSYGL